MIRRPPRSTPIKSSAASDVYKRQVDLRVAVFAEFGKTKVRVGGADYWFFSGKTISVLPA